MESMREWVYNAIEIEKKKIRYSEEQANLVGIQVLVEYHEQSIRDAKQKIQAYEQVLEKLAEQEQFGDVIPF